MKRGVAELAAGHCRSISCFYQPIPTNTLCRLNKGLVELEAGCRSLCCLLTLLQ